MPRRSRSRLRPADPDSNELAAGGLITLSLARFWQGKFRARRTVWFLCSVICLTQPLRAEDVVVVSQPQQPDGLRRKGTIVDFDGQFLTLELASGRQEQLASSSVLRYQTQRVAEHQKADRLFAQGRYADAAANYLRAVKTEKRTWMRREILAQLARCYENMDQIGRAGETFLLIVRSAARTRLLDAMPLNWIASEPPAEVADRALRWIENRDLPAARLMGASWLLSSAQRGRALEVLQKLSQAEDQRIAMLAEMQLWRDELVSVTADQLARWAQQVERLDSRLRAGPYYLLGKAYARHNRHAAAALALLRVPISYPQQRALAAEALFLAGQELQQSGDSAAAETVYRELLQKHPEHRLAPTARQRLADGVSQ